MRHIGKKDGHTPKEKILNRPSGGIGKSDRRIMDEEKPRVRYKYPQSESEVYKASLEDRASRVVQVVAEKFELINQELELDRASVSTEELREELKHVCCFLWIINNLVVSNFREREARKELRDEVVDQLISHGMDAELLTHVCAHGDRLRTQLIKREVVNVFSNRQPMPIPTPETWPALKKTILARSEILLKRLADGKLLKYKTFIYKTEYDKWGAFKLLLMFLPEAFRLRFLDHVPLEGIYKLKAGGNICGFNSASILFKALLSITEKCDERSLAAKSEELEAPWFEGAQIRICNNSINSMMALLNNGPGSYEDVRGAAAELAKGLQIYCFREGVNQRSIDSDKGSISIEEELVILAMSTLSPDDVKELFPTNSDQTNKDLQRLVNCCDISKLRFPMSIIRRAEDDIEKLRVTLLDMLS